MFKNLSLEEKIKIKTRINQFLFLVVTLTAIFGGYKIRVLTESSIPWLIFILLLFAVSIVWNEILQKWIYETISDDICRSIMHTNSSSNNIIKETNTQQELLNKHLQLLKKSVDYLEKLKNSSEQTKQSAEQMSEKTVATLNLSGEEQKSVEINIEKMSTLKQKIEIIADLILELSEHTQQIGSIIGVVEDITEQTNMLALNAAVEAARAGEHGKGFAVVAGEIRKLADESKQATTKITSLIRDIQQATNSTVMATEEGSKEIESGVELAHNIAHNIEKLRKTIQETVYSVDKIVFDADNQIKSATEVHSSITELDNGLTESAEKIKQNLESLNELLKTSEDLKDHILGINYDKMKTI